MMALSDDSYVKIVQVSSASVRTSQRKHYTSIIKTNHGLHVKCVPLYCPLYVIIGIHRQIFVKIPCVKLYENPLSGSRAIPCGQTDGKIWRCLLLLYGASRKIAYIRWTGVCTQKAIRWNPNPNHTRNTSRPLRRLCCRPAVFFRHLRPTVLSIQPGKIRRPFKKCYHFDF
jgi:hypothetical protein